MTPRKATRRAVCASTTATNTRANAALENPDAALMVLGRNLDRALVDWSANIRQSNEARRLFEAAVFQATGITVETAKADPELWENMQSDYQKTRHRLANKTSDGGQSYKEWKAVHDRVEPIVNAIFALPALTLADLVVKARAAAYVNSEWWLDPETVKKDGASELKALVEDICRIAGFPMINVLSKAVLGP